MDGMANRDAGGSASSGESHAFVVDRGERPGRLDRFLADKLRESGLSREKVKELIREGRVMYVDVDARTGRVIRRSQ